MASAPPPPPPAVLYPPPPPTGPGTTTEPAAVPPQHKLSTQRIAAIAAGAVALVGGLVAIFALTGGHESQTPDNNDVVPPPSHSTPAPTQPSSAPSSQPSSGPTTEPSQPGATGGSAVDLGNGVTIVPAAGWSDTGTASSGQADFVSPDNETEFFVGTGTATSSDVVSVLQDDINTQVQSSGLSDVQVGDVASDQTGSQLFDAFASVPFSGTASSQQGTTEIHGVFGELLNTSTGFSALIFVQSAADNLPTDDVTAMVTSLLGS